MPSPIKKNSVSAHNELHSYLTIHWDLRRDLHGQQLSEIENRLRPDKHCPLTAGTPPNAKIWASNLGRGIMEILLGMRPVTQLRRWVVPALYTVIEQRCEHSPRYRCRGCACTIRSTTTCEIRKGIIEATTTLIVIGRIHAVALRLEDFRGRWLLTALDII